MDRLWNRTDRSSGCWIWTGCVDGSGYGLISLNGKMVKTHRLSWVLSNGQIPEGLFVCHHCDNRKCINPDHLFIGTNKDNMQDKVRKGRKNGGGPAMGEHNGSAKMNAKKVIKIRELHKNGMSEKKISKQIGVGKSQVHRIIARQNWKQVD